MAGTITDWPLTLEQFLSLPEAKPALEMGCDGEIQQKVSPTTEHAYLQFEVMRRLDEYARPRKLGRSGPEQRIILGGVTRVPDVSFYRQSRLPLDDMGRWIPHPRTPPDIVAEIYSPGQEKRRDLAVKAAWYVEQGVGLVLLVDPERQRVTAYSSTGQAVYTDDEPLPLDEFLPGLRFTPAELFGALRP